MDMNGREMYFEAVKLAEEGSHESALTKLQMYLQDHPMDGEALNDAGTILFCLHRGREAIECFQRARSCCDGEKLTQVYWNLCEACIEENRPEMALELLDRMAEGKVLNIDILNRLARLYVDREDCGTAIDLLLRSLELSPEQEVLAPMLEVIRSRRTGLVVAGSPEGLASDLVEFFRVRYPGAVCRTAGLSEIQSALEPGGILLFFGADPVLRELTNRPKTHKLILRLSWQDLYHPALSEIQWGHVDALIVPDELSRAQFLERLDIVPAGLHVAAVGPGLETESVLFQPKGRGKKVAAIGPWDGAANPMLLLQCIQKLHRMDEDMRFYLAGEFTDPAIENYLLHLVEKMELDNCVFLDGKPRNWGRWLKDKHYIVSTAVDGRCMPAVWRAMAAGLKPVVHEFPGADQYLAGEALFLTAEDFCDKIAGGAYEPEAYRRVALQGCSRRRELQGLDQVVRMIEKSVCRKPYSPARPPASFEPAVATRGFVRPTAPASDSRPNSVSLQPEWSPEPVSPPAAPSRSIEEIAMEALNAARRQSNANEIQPGHLDQGGLSGPF